MGAHLKILPKQTNTFTTYSTLSHSSTG